MGEELKGRMGYGYGNGNANDGRMRYEMTTHSGRL